MLHRKSSLPATPFASQNSLTLGYTHHLGVIATDNKIILIFVMNNDHNPIDLFTDTAAILIFVMNNDHNPIDLFTDTAAILNLLDLRSIMGCPEGHDHDPIYSLSIYPRFSGKKRTSLYISR